MQLLAHQTTTIARPLEAVFRYACDLERFGEWFPGVLAIESANTLAPAQPGKEYLETVEIPFRGKRKVKITVKEAEAGRRLVTEGRLPPLMPRMEIVFEEVGPAACQVTWRMLSRNNGLLARWTVVPLARRVMRKRAAIGVRRLKDQLERAGRQER
ncbi:SRPBCC family protein [Aquabacterium sp. A7-Y]|uniref:SRPBCC family protein n=1 Tax=Aquabacterium sp. A7-Y TaxID=1349605 RepID=UPI00223E45FC|nr:SRPBCC family protein [Aquabacterium sp. A7-Y]MCW7538595.1 SRPBCC family protein [Aquabacterium sp. A7-Y]